MGEVATMLDFGADLTVRNGPGRSFDQLLNMSGVPVAAVSIAHSS